VAYLAMESEAARLFRVAKAEAERQRAAVRAIEALDIPPARRSTEPVKLAGALRHAKAVDEAARMSASAGSQRPSVSACAPAIDLGDCARG
jgi:hypothetical protein